MQTCSYCGRENEDGAFNCRECGTELEAGARVRRASEAKEAEARKSEPPLASSPRLRAAAETYCAFYFSFLRGAQLLVNMFVFFTVVGCLLHSDKFFPVDFELLKKHLTWFIVMSIYPLIQITAGLVALWIRNPILTEDSYDEYVVGHIAYYKKGWFLKQGQAAVKEAVFAIAVGVSALVCIVLQLG